MILREKEDTVIARDHSTMMEAILTRDQRTTSHRVLDRRSQGGTIFSSTAIKADGGIGASSGTNSSSGNCTSANGSGATIGTLKKMHCPNITSVTRKQRTALGRRVQCDDAWLVRCSSNKRIRRFASTTWLRLGSLLITLLIVSVHGAPTTMTLENRQARLNSPPKWVNPCGLAAEDFDADPDVVQLRDEQLLTQVVVLAKTALMHAQIFRDDYIKHTFNTDFADLHSAWKQNHYDWLPGEKEIPKQLGQQLDKEFLDKLELDTTLLNAYEYMQTYAVGLEQIVWDQKDHHLKFEKDFADTEYKLRSVLCEIHVALVERGVTQRADVMRDAMSSEYRSMSKSATYRNLRDWLIFRDYMNGLEYVVQVFEHLRRGLES